MNRATLYQELSKIAKVAQISNRTGTIKTETLVLARASSLMSLNSHACFDTWEVHCYVPANSLLQLDQLTNKVIECLRGLDVEITNLLSGDFYDNEFDAYMTSIQIRIPRAIV